MVNADILASGSDDNTGGEIVGNVMNCCTLCTVLTTTTAHMNARDRRVWLSFVITLLLV